MAAVEEKMAALAADDVDDDISFTSVVNDKRYYTSLTPETLMQIKRNNPDVTSLRVKVGDNNIGFRLAGNEEWERDAGVSIGGNTHLKKLCVELSPMIIEGSFKSFCKGLSSNRSIETLTFERGYLFEDTFAILSPFFERNKCLSNIEFIGCEIIGNGIHLLSKALSNRIHKGSMSELKIWSSDISGGAQATAELMNSLEGCHNLVNLKWAFSNFCGQDAYVALANILQSPLCHLKKLDLSHTIIDDEITILANALRTNKTLKLLKLRGCGIRDQSAMALGNALENNNVLKALQLDANLHVTSEGWRRFSACLQNTNSALDRLSIQECSIDDESMAELASALANNSTLKILELCNNSRINDAGWQAFSECLRSPNTALEKVDMTGCKITDEVMILFSEALARNTRLRELSISDNTLLTSRSWASLSNLLCNKSSIESTYASNHTLCSLGDHPNPQPAELVSLLHMNANGNKAEVVRQKILQYHFLSGGDINAEQFIDMEMAVLPHAISWIGRDDIGQPLLYSLFQSMPFLFDSDHKTKSMGDKRKRG